MQTAACYRCGKESDPPSVKILSDQVSVLIVGDCSDKGYIESECFQGGCYIATNPSRSPVHGSHI